MDVLSLRWICIMLVGVLAMRDDTYNEFSYLATASLYTNPAVARLTTSKHKSEPSMLKEERNINISFATLWVGKLHVYG